MKKRKPEIVVISDVHLGTFGCHAKELLEYLNSIKPKKLILNGDIIDIWQFRKSYFPKSHLDVIKKILDLNSKGTEVIYITGNHDEMLRKFSDISLGKFSIVDKLVLDLDGKKAWFFHGDIFDVSVSKAKWIAKLGGWGYDLLIVLNKMLNWFLLKTGKKKYSLSKKIKNSVKTAVKFISDFERTAAELAIEQGYKYVICGHIHQPRMVRKVVRNSTCLYLNSGDWTENLTALEYKNKKWSLVHHSELELGSAQPPYIAATTIL
ncbi:UDP-2,3-diacylglucosamine diphosphatase [Christiangramia gaetbulicola]|uniref:UDP-2,3-diacylglucosamine diphosphatase n=1 Tax=Christiangramia gaetbulicola TaxID=703340 RepID=UPI000D357195|nr:UDP-2,3-diacylglucosamine diphosphatase [Christiangramia gaetbulicola]